MNLAQHSKGDTTQYLLKFSILVNKSQIISFTETRPTKIVKCHFGLPGSFLWFC